MQPTKLLQAICLSLMAGCTLSAAATDRQAEVLASSLRDPDGRVMVVAHRACHERLPENSLAAIARCIELGVDVVELDARLTRDGELVVVHDETLERTTDGSGAVSQRSLAELKQLRLRQGGGGAEAELTEHRIPTLREVMQLIDGRILVDLDAKGSDLPAVWERSRALFREMGVTGEVTVKLTASRDEAFFDQVPLISDVIYLQRVDQRLGRTLAEVVEQGASRQPAAYPVIFSDLDYLRAGAASVRRSGARLWVEPYHDGSVAGLGDVAAARDPDGSWGRLLELGASVLLTDRPEALLDYLRARGMR